MRPLRLFAEHYGPYEMIDWNVPVGVTAILGRNEAAEGIDSNGAGKTKLLEILPLALFGPKLSWRDYLTLGGDGAALLVGCEFEHAGHVYRVRRRFDARGRGTSSLDLDYTDHDNGWVSIARDRQDATEQELLRILGVTEATFSHSVFAAQGAAHFADPDIPPRERKAVLAEALGLDLYDRLLQACRGDIRTLEEQLAGVRARTGDWEQQLAERPEAERMVEATRDCLAACEIDVETATERHNTLRARYDEWRQAAARVKAAEQLAATCRGAHATAQTQQQEALAAGAEAIQLDGQLAPLQAKAERLPEILAAQRAAREREQAAERVMHERERLLTDARIADLEAEDVESDASDAGRRRYEAGKQADHLLQHGAGEARCDRCGQTLGSEALEQTITSLQAEAATAQVDHDECEAEAKRLRERAASLRGEAERLEVPSVDESEMIRLDTAAEEARAAGMQAAALKERAEGLRRLAHKAAAPETLEVLERTRANMAAAEEALTQARSDAPDVAALQALAADTLQAEVARDRAVGNLNQWMVEFGVRQERLRSLNELAERLEQAAAEVAGLEERLVVLRTLERAYGPNGIPALIMETAAIPQIEAEANRVLAALGVPYTVELRTQREQRSTDRLKDTLDVVVCEPRGPRRYETFSGGERARANVALRIALARLLVHRSGSPIEVFALDEVEHLDRAGLARLAELLRELQQEIPVVLLVSHLPELVESFDQTVTVVHAQGRSRLAEAPTEAVAA